MDEPTIADLYEPVQGGWRIWMTNSQAARRLDPGERIGVVAPLPETSGHEDNAALERRPPRDDPRRHRRPLYPPADRSLLWNPAQLEKLRRTSFRPLVLAYNAPRFVFDLHLAGGLLGHLRLGLANSGGASRWLDEFDDIVASYTEGHMEYRLRDEALAGVEIRLSAAALAGAVGLVVRYQIETPGPADLVWYYGGASAFFSNYSFGAAAFAFEPSQCTRNQVGWTDQVFSLWRLFSASDPVMQQACAVPRLLPGWAALIKGAGSTDAPCGWGEPEAALGGPDELWRRTEQASAGTGPLRPACLAVQAVHLVGGSREGYLAVGAGGDIEEVVWGPEAAYRGALSRNCAIASRVLVVTPDAHLDAAARMMAFALEGTWGDTAYLHGAWSWRSAYLGWRGWYGPTCYGWTDRVAGSIRNHIELGRVTAGDDQGAQGHILEAAPAVYYNMNEVFLDHVRQYFDYTADWELMRQALPALKQIVAWEDRRLQPGNAGLYENSLNTWISDSHWNIRGQCTQASAYMLGTHRFLASLASRLDSEPDAWAAKAERIRAAMQRHLWQPRQGVFAEYRDTAGQCLLHPEPELPTLYHAAEFQAADPLQVYQMLHWADTHLAQERTPGGGRMYWSSNWHPNRGHSYTHSTYELAYAEELNFALTQYLAGRAEEGYALLAASLCGIYNGPTPGGLACHAYVDGRQRANDEFADAISMWVRVLFEGLFGIGPRCAEGRTELCPQFPAHWPQALIYTRHFRYRWQRTPGGQRLDWGAPDYTVVCLRLPLRAAAIEAVRVDGQAVAHQVEPGVGLTWLRVTTPRAIAGSIEVEYTPAAVSAPTARQVRAGAPVRLDLAEHGAVDWLDPQSLLRDVRRQGSVLEATATPEPGPGLLFLLAGSRDCPVWLPVPFTVEPAAAAPRCWEPPPPTDLGRWTLVDLGPIYNSALTEVVPRVLAATQPPAAPASTVGFAYRNDHFGGRLEPLPSDAAWRAKVGPDGVAWTADGVPFRSARAGNNIAVVTRAGGFPERLEIPVGAGGQTLYLMLSGITFPAQSHVPNLRLVLRWDVGPDQTVELANPDGIGDCWSSCVGRFHDTPANGFENLGGRFGPAGSSAVPDLARPVAVDTEAHLLALPLRPGARLERLTIEAVANDAVFGLMGASVLR